MTNFDFMSQRNARSKNQPPARFRIEGVTVSYDEIAERLNITRAVAVSRMASLRGASGAITWDRLRTIGTSVRRKKAA